MLKPRMNTNEREWEAVWERGRDERQGHPGLLHVGHQVAGAGLHDLGLDEAGGALLFERRPGGEGPCRHEGEVLAAQGTGDDHQEVGGAEDGAGEVRQGLASRWSRSYRGLETERP